MIEKLNAAAAWACVIFIVCATLSSAGARPELTTTETPLVVFVEHFGAFGVLGFLFVFAYPSRIVLVCLLVFGSAVVLELLQVVIPDRDARFIDAAEKLAGGVAGILAAKAVVSFAVRRRRKI